MKNIKKSEEKEKDKTEEKEDKGMDAATVLESTKVTIDGIKWAKETIEDYKPIRYKIQRTEIIFKIIFMFYLRDNVKLSEIEPFVESFLFKNYKKDNKEGFNFIKYKDIDIGILYDFTRSQDSDLLNSFIQSEFGERSNEDFLFPFVDGGNVTLIPQLTDTTQLITILDLISELKKAILEKYNIKKDVVMLNIEFVSNADDLLIEDLKTNIEKNTKKKVLISKNIKNIVQLKIKPIEKYDIDIIVKSINETVSIMGTLKRVAREHGQVRKVLKLWG